MKRRNWIGILILGAIILLVAAIVLPCMRTPRIVVNESAAIASVTTIITAEEAYRDTYGGYADSLTNLGGSQPCVRSAATACLLDQVLASGARHGYRFAAIGSNPIHGANTTYVTGAAPEAFNRTGTRLFCATEKGVIRADMNAQGSSVPPGGKQCERFGVLE